MSIYSSHRLNPGSQRISSDSDGTISNHGSPPTVDASKVPAGPAKSGDDATGIHEAAVKLEDGVAVKPESEMDETLVKAEPGSVVATVLHGVHKPTDSKGKQPQSA